MKPLSNYFDPPDRESRQFSDEHEKLLSRLFRPEQEQLRHELPALDFMTTEEIRLFLSLTAQFHDKRRASCAEGGRFGAKVRWRNTEEKLEKIEQEDRRLRQFNPNLSKTDRAAIISKNFPELGAPGTIRKKLQTAR